MPNPAAKVDRRRPWIIAATGTALAAGLIALALHGLGPPNLSRYHDRSTLVVDREGRPLRGFLTSDQAWRFATTPDQVAPLYLAMLKAYEDHRFDRHGGVDPLALLRAGWQALANGRIVSGASTLTMQAARLLEPRPRGLTAKLIEMHRALQLERRLGKAEILAIYLTLAPFGGNLEGLRAASLAYFGKEPAHLSPSEAALMVVLPQAPNRLRPDRHPERARAARNKVLERAVRAGVIDRQTAEEAKQAALPHARRFLPFHAPHLAERLARKSPDSERIETTIERDRQTALETLIRDTARALGAEVGIAALVVENATREVRAYAGSSDYFAERRHGMIDMVRATRSPGSALKPFIYGLAFDDLIAHPDSVIADAPSRFGLYAPRNFARDFSGDVTLREALQYSLNIPAVAVLDQLGPLQLQRRLEHAGVPLRLPGEGLRPSLAIALGGAGVSLEEMTMLYAAVADGGQARPLRLTPGDDASEARALFGPLASWYLADILEAGPRPAGFLEGGTGSAIAFKTGTSYGQRDAWALGFTDRYTIGIWVGRPDGAPCSGCVGIQAAAPILFRVFDLLPDPGQAVSAAGPPEGALAGPTSQLPPGLRRFGPPGLEARRGEGPPPTIAFPVDGTRFPVPAGANFALPLKAQGGKRPFRWLVNGRPIGGPNWRHQALWQPDGPGFAQVQLIDARGRSARVELLIEGGGLSGAQ